MSEPTKPVLLDMTAVGHILDCTAEQATALVKGGLLRGFQQGGPGSYVTRPADIGDYLSRQRHAAPRTVKR